MKSEPDPENSIPIGISSCLLGTKVRYDGGHKHDRFITDTLGQYFEWVPICPEVEMGLGTPRESIRLVRDGEDIRLVTQNSSRDLTEEMRSFARHRTNLLHNEDLCGYILKSDSPSCGVMRVRIYTRGGAVPAKTGRGMFATALLEKFPDLPVEEEGRLCDPRIRENWIERVFAYRRLKSLWSSRWSLGLLIEFHTAHKLSVMAHSPAAYNRLGRLLAGGRSIPRRNLQTSYQTEFMGALTIIATRGRHANVLEHMAGYLKKLLGDEDRHELNELIADYQEGYVPLIVPVTLLNHHVRKHGIAYLSKQYYLHPHPKELALRSSI